MWETLIGCLPFAPWPGIEPTALLVDGMTFQPTELPNQGPTAVFVVPVPVVAEALHWRVTEPWWSLYNTCFSLPLLCWKMMLAYSGWNCPCRIGFQDIRKFLRVGECSGCLRALRISLRDLGAYTLAAAYSQPRPCLGIQQTESPHFRLQPLPRHSLYSMTALYKGIKVKSH